MKDLFIYFAILCYLCDLLIYQRSNVWFTAFRVLLSTYYHFPTSVNNCLFSSFINLFQVFILFTCHVLNLTFFSLLFPYLYILIHTHQFFSTHLRTYKFGIFIYSFLLFNFFIFKFFSQFFLFYFILFLYSFNNFIIIIYSLEFFTSALADGLSLEIEGQQVSSSLQYFSQYSGRFQ